MKLSKKKTREYWFKIKIYVESNDGFLFNSDKNKGMWIVEKKTETKLGSQRKLYLQ